MVAILCLLFWAQHLHTNAFCLLLSSYISGEHAAFLFCSLVFLHFQYGLPITNPWNYSKTRFFDDFSSCPLLPPGELPIEGVLHIRTLGLLHNI
jgi:hypothetical protein